MKRLRDFESIAAFLSEREVDELQAAIDARREARGGRDVRRPGRAGRPGRGGVQAEAGGYRYDARRLLRVSYERWLR